jgi:hypothetical protein
MSSVIIPRFSNLLVIHCLMIQLAKCVVAKLHVPFPRTLAISRTMVKALSPIVNWSVMNQSHGHWLLGGTRHWFLGDAWHWLLGNTLHFLIFTCQELHEMLPH